MKITKFGHACFLIDTSASLSPGKNGLRIITDPAGFSKGQNKAKKINLILITHKDMDHLDLDSLKTILKNNPKARIITNKSVGEVLDKEKIPCEIVEHGQSVKIKGVLIEGFGEKHALMHSSIPQQQNTGYFIADKLFFPGDAFTLPGKTVDILALPTVAPWLKISEVIDYALTIKPEYCFPFHDGISKISSFFDKMLASMLKPAGIKYVPLEIGKETEF